MDESTPDPYDPCNNSSEGEWSDETCITLAYEEQFPKAVLDINVQKDIINRFFNFYLGAKPPKGLTVTDLLFATIAIMPLHYETEELIWGSDQYDDNGTLFFLTPEDKLKAELNKLKEIRAAEKPVFIDDVKFNEENIANIKIDDIKIDDIKIDDIKIDDIKIDDIKIDDIKIDDIKIDYIKIEEKYHLIEEKTEKQDIAEETNKPLLNCMYTEQQIEDKHYEKTKEQEFCESNEELLMKAIPNLPEDIKWYGSRTIKKSDENVKLEYGPKENSAFSVSCSKLLEEWDTNKQGRISLKFFFGMVALTLMRACTKTYMHLVNTFAGRKFLDSISFTKRYFSYSTPQKKCVLRCFRTFKKRDSQTYCMFAKIVIQSFYIEKLRKENGYSGVMAINIFRLTLLAHTADHGLGLVHMLESIRNIESVLKATYCKETAESWHKLKYFIEKYMTEKSKEMTYHWAHVINKSYYKELSCSNNYALATILAVFVEKEQDNPSIWQSAWVKKDGYEHKKFTNLGLAMYEQYKRDLQRDRNNFLTNVF